MWLPSKHKLSNISAFLPEFYYFLITHFLFPLFAHEPSRDSMHLLGKEIIFNTEMSTCGGLGLFCFDETGKSWLNPI